MLGSEALRLAFRDGLLVQAGSCLVECGLDHFHMVVRRRDGSSKWLPVTCSAASDMQCWGFIHLSSWGWQRRQLLVFTSLWCVAHGAFCVETKSG